MSSLLNTLVNVNIAGIACDMQMYFKCSQNGSWQTFSVEGKYSYNLVTVEQLGCFRRGRCCNLFCPCSVKQP